MAWTLVRLAGLSLVCSVVCMVIDRIVAPTRNGPGWTVVGGWLFAFSAALMLWLAVH